MKVVAFNGSSRKDGNTAILLKHVLAELNGEGIETELIQLNGECIRGCSACMGCFRTKNEKCVIKDDHVNEYISKMKESDGIILGSPTYFADTSVNMKALIERSGMVARANDDMFKRKPGASVVAVRRAGASHVFSSLNFFFLVSQMIIVGSSYWNIGRGLAPGDVEDDTEGIQTMRNLGINMAWLLKKISG